MRRVGPGAGDRPLRSRRGLQGRSVCRDGASAGTRLAPALCSALPGVRTPLLVPRPLAWDAGSVAAPGTAAPQQLRRAGKGEPWAATGSLGGNGDRVRTSQEASLPGPVSPHGGHPWLPGRVQGELGLAPDSTKGQPGRLLGPAPNAGSRTVPHVPGVAGSATERPSATRPSAGRSVVAQTIAQPTLQIGKGSRQARPPPHKGQLGSAVKIFPRHAQSHGFQPFERMWLVGSGLGG